MGRVERERDIKQCQGAEMMSVEVRAVFFFRNIHNLRVFQLATVYFRSVGHRLHECGVDSGAVQGRQLESNSDDDYADDRP